MTHLGPECMTIEMNKLKVDRKNVIFFRFFSSLDLALQKAFAIKVLEIANFTPLYCKPPSDLSLSKLS